MITDEKVNKQLHLRWSSESKIINSVHNSTEMRSPKSTKHSKKRKIVGSQTIQDEKDISSNQIRQQWFSTRQVLQSQDER